MCAGWRALWSIWGLLNGSRASACRGCGGLAETFLDLVVSDLRGFGHVWLMRFAEGLDELERLRVADVREGFEQSGIDSWCVVGALQKWIKDVGTFEF